MFPRRLAAAVPTRSAAFPRPRHSDIGQHISLYCAIYRPQFGNYYHWAFAAHLVATDSSSSSSPDSDSGPEEWHVYEVVQAIEDGAFEPTHQARVDSASLQGFRAPLIPLGEILTSGCEEGRWEKVQAVVLGQTIGEPPGWNCQDYVLGIWEELRDRGVIGEEVWSGGKMRMLPFFGPDFGEVGAEYDAEKEAGEEVGGLNQVDIVRRGQLSEEFVAESDEDW